MLFLPWFLLYITIGLCYPSNLRVLEYSPRVFNVFTSIRHQGRPHSPKYQDAHSPLLGVAYGLHNFLVNKFQSTPRICNAARESYRAVKCRLIWRFRGQALLLRVLHVVACDNVRDCVFLKDDSVKKGFNSYELNFSLPTNSQNKLTELN